MFLDFFSFFSGSTRVEVVTVIARCGTDTEIARRALVKWIRHKQKKGRSTEHIMAKLRDIELKFIRDAALRRAFQDARTETMLPRDPELRHPPERRRRVEVIMPGSHASVVVYRDARY